MCNGLDAVYSINVCTAIVTDIAIRIFIESNSAVSSIATQTFQAFQPGAAARGKLYTYIKAVLILFMPSMFPGFLGLQFEHISMVLIVPCLRLSFR